MAGWDRQTTVLISGVAGLLLLATAIGVILRYAVHSQSGRQAVENLNARTRAWWVMVLIFGAAIGLGQAGACFLFAGISFLALREMLTLAPTRRGDHHTLFWAFFVMIPLQYYLIYIRWYGVYSIFIPVYAFLFLAIRSTLTGDFNDYLERTAKVQWGVMICVYCLSHAPALLMLDVREQPHSWKLLVYLVVVVQMSGVLQYVWGRLLGRLKIAPHISPNKTWEGFVGGVITAAAIGAVLHGLTPFTIERAALIALIIAIMGFFGGIVMSAVKRDAGIKDFGHLIEGHGGMLDRIDSLCFASPVFFHLVRYWYT
jgi:phosphatidate cytidylyltransferase